MRNGFTLIEFLIAVAILVIVSGAGLIGLSRYKGGQDIELSMEEIISVVRDVQKRSITEQDGKQWGIRFVNASSSYEIWSGSSYASGTVDKLYSLRRNVILGNPSTSTVDTIFSAISGKLAETRIISLLNTRKDGIVGDIVMTERGTVTSRLEHGLVGYWHFDEATSTKAYDSSGFSITGTLTNGPTWQTSSNCKSGKCLSFDGTNDYIDLNASASYANTLTVTAWVFHNSASGWDDIVAGGCGSILFGFSSNVLNFGGQCNNPFNPITYATNINSAWHHVAGVYNGSTASLYVDGTLVNSASRSGSFSNFAPNIGASGDSAESFYGSIDEVRIYNRALSAAEVLNLYNDLK